ncbi:ureidoglycolate lyase [Ottowia thiooxydans]|uniref:Ureidoglycolate lyase n=1 Tax=Ottowia thiooxydans TaxID=219182 RepID=A0ABV2QFB0_9BURK
MTDAIAFTHLLPMLPLHAQSFAPYGTVLGAPPAGPLVPAFHSVGTDFWQTHVFNTGVGGEPEFLWVRYRDHSVAIGVLEVHHLTEQAIVPLTGEIIQIVATGDTPDPASFRAFRVPVGLGICMRPGCWHTTRVTGGEVTCLMATRRSTTTDLIGHFSHALPAAESALASVRTRITCA